jgi:hypothetical protein
MTLGTHHPSPRRRFAARFGWAIAALLVALVSAAATKGASSWFDRAGREPPPALLDLGKGQRLQGLSSQRYDASGVPQPSEPAQQRTAAAPPATRQLASIDDLAEAISQAREGEVLELAPGSYALTQGLVTGHGGTASRPIVVRAARPGTVSIRVDTLQAVVVRQPYWVFENLDWKGVCARHDDCEHAFHVVGAARGTVLRNQRMTDFNAHVKINGERGHWPDDGLLQFNTLDATSPRLTSAPVVPVDLVAASGWQLLDNRVEGFVKRGGNGLSYGMFMKGGGRGGRIERNQIVCTPSGVAQAGQRVGLSIGDGGTGAAYCRSVGCDTEHSDAIVSNNLVAHCNDVGIDVARSRNSRVLHNTLVNTAGILLRNPPIDARVDANLLDAGVRGRIGSTLSEGDNLSARDLGDHLVDPDALDLRWRRAPPLVSTASDVVDDFCARPRPRMSPPGATAAPRC